MQDTYSSSRVSYREQVFPNKGNTNKENINHVDRPQGKETNRPIDPKHLFQLKAKELCFANQAFAASCHLIGIFRGKTVLNTNSGANNQPYHTKII